MINDVNTFMLVTAIGMVLFGSLVVFVDIPFGKNMPKIA